MLLVDQQAIKSLFRNLPLLQNKILTKKNILFSEFDAQASLNYKDDWQAPLKLLQFMRASAVWHQYLDQKIAKECAISAAMRWTLMRLEYFEFNQIEIYLAALEPRVVQLKLPDDIFTIPKIAIVQFKDVPNFDGYRFFNKAENQFTSWVAI